MLRLALPRYLDIIAGTHVVCMNVAPYSKHLLYEGRVHQLARERESWSYLCRFRLRPGWRRCPLGPPCRG